MGEGGEAGDPRRSAPHLQRPRRAARAAPGRVGHRRRARARRRGARRPRLLHAADDRRQPGDRRPRRPRGDVRPGAAGVEGEGPRRGDHAVQRVRVRPRCVGVDERHPRHQPRRERGRGRDEVGQPVPLRLRRAAVRRGKAIGLRQGARDGGPRLLPRGHLGRDRRAGVVAVAFAADGAVGYITLDKPPANSYDRAFMEEFSSAVDAAAADSSVKAVIVRSASKKFFCAGADIKAFLANDTDGNMAMIELGHDVLARISTIPKVFIAQIEGHALGGGLEISLACDLRFGARGRYKLGVPEVTLGLLPGNGGTQRLARLVGTARALDLMVTGRQMSPGEAHGLGVLNRLFAAEETADRTRAYADALAAGATAAIGEIKLATYEGVEQPIAEGLARERAGIAKLFETADAREGLGAFADKRKPEFTGA